MPRLSAVIANYNYARYLGEAIDSVLAQDFPEPVEIVVVDDGSVDDSKAVLHSYGNRIIALFQENHGYASAFNKGIAASSGDVVCLLDADDVWSSDKVSKVHASFSKNPEASIVQHFLQDADSSLRPLPVSFPDWPERARIEDYLEGRFPLTATSALSFRREALLRLLPIPEELKFLYADDYLAVGALFQSDGINIREPLAYHRVHGANFCAGSYGDPNKLAADFKMRAVFRERISRLAAEHGKKFGEKYLLQEKLELLRREILYHALSGDRRAALRKWARAAPRHIFSRAGAWRAATCAIAAAWPALYLALYDAYARRRRG